MYVCRPLVQSALGIMILVCGFLGVAFLVMLNGVMGHIREPFYRETASGTYAGGLFPIAYFLVELPWLVVLSFIVSCNIAVFPHETVWCGELTRFWFGSHPTT